MARRRAMATVADGAARGNGLGLSVSVYRDADGSDCTNGGVTARLTRLVLIADTMDGYLNPATAAGRGELLLLKRDRMGYRGYLYAVPAMVVGGVVVEAPVPEGHVGWMAGGNFVGTSDGRFSEAVSPLGLVPVHDRSEDDALYRSNCD